MWIEAFQKIHQAGKARHFGISTHTRPWMQHVVEKFPEVEMVIFPCTARTREKGTPPTAANVEEGNMPTAWTSDQSKSIFQTVREKNVGLVTIKPFIGGQLFPPLGKEGPAPGVGNKQENELARLTLQCILTNDAITATVPGMDTVYQVENAARASYKRALGMTPAEQQWLARRHRATVEQPARALPVAPRLGSGVGRIVRLVFRWPLRMARASSLDYASIRKRTRHGAFRTAIGRRCLPIPRTVLG